MSAIVHTNMKNLTAMAAILLLAGCATRPPGNPFATIQQDKVCAILVGDVVRDPLETRPRKGRFEEYFRIEDPETVRELRGLMQSAEPVSHIALMGILSYQRFVNRWDRSLADTHIVNFDSTVVIDDPFASQIVGYDAVHSKEFCRRVYDLMLVHCPEVIESQRTFYLETSRQQLEGLLFDGDQTKGPAQPSTGE